MIEILDIGAEIQAMQAAESGNWQPLADLVTAERPLGAAARAMIAARLTNKFKRKRGDPVDPATAQRKLYLWYEFLWTKHVEQWSNNDSAIYSKMAENCGFSESTIKKYVSEGEKTRGVERSLGEIQIRDAIELRKAGGTPTRFWE